MKTIITLSIICFQLIFISAQSYLAVPAQSKIVWKGYGEVGGFTQTGTIRLKDAKIMYNEGSLKGQIILDMSTISHEDKQLENHLKDKDFFNVKKHPASTFTIILMENMKVSGSLEMNGITHKISFDIELDEKENGLFVKGKATIDRTKFNIKYNSSSYFQDLGNYAIKNEFDIEFKILFEKG